MPPAPYILEMRLRSGEGATCIGELRLTSSPHKAHMCPGRAQQGSKIDRKSVYNGSLEAPGRPWGEPWATLGGSLGAKADFRAIFGALGGTSGGSKIKEKAFENHLKFDVNSEP